MKHIQNQVIAEGHKGSKNSTFQTIKKRKGNSKSQKEQLKNLNNLYTNAVKLKLLFLLNEVNHECIIEKDRQVLSYLFAYIVYCFYYLLIRKF